jgi:hypothetical protein
MYEYSEINVPVGLRRKVRIKYDIQKGHTEPCLLGISQLPSYVKISFVLQYIVHSHRSGFFRAAAEISPFCCVLCVLLKKIPEVSKNSRKI